MGAFYCNNKTRVIGKSHQTAVKPAMMSGFEQMERTREEPLEIFLRGRLVDRRRTKHKGGTTNVEHFAGQAAATTSQGG